LKKNNTPPAAKQAPKTLEIHGDKRIDKYFWMNDRENPEVITHLEAENGYYDAMTAHTKTLQTELFDEMKSRIKLDDESVPFMRRGYWYYARYEKQGDYPIFCRKKGSLEAEEEVMFDGNVMAKGHEFFNMAGISISSNNNLAAFGVDTVSRRKYTLRIKNLKTGELYADTIKNTTGSVAWANDNKTFFYTRKDEQTLRSDRVYQHVLGEDPAEDKCVFHEGEDTFNVGVYKSKSQQYIIIGTHSTLSDEYHILDADKPEEPFRLFQKRQPAMEYGISHYNQHFYIITNKDEATNFKLMKTPVGQTEQEHW